MGGLYRLRIEDTDAERSTQAAVEAIIDGLNWLELAPDGEIIMQSARAPRHREIAEALIGRGAAFRCYCSPEEVEALRTEAHAEGRALRSPWREPSPRQATPDRPFVVRLRAPDAGAIDIDDAVQGPVRFEAKTIDDLVLLRADGTPTYMLAVVVDDYDMGVTHIIRGDDHLNNAGRQLPIILAMDWPKPAYAHIPLIHGPDGAKLSKRHGALGVDAYRDMGFLPEGLSAYLLRLGWGAGDVDVVTRDEAIALFSLDGIGRSPSRLDFDKMASVNAVFMKNASDDRLLTLALDRPEASGWSAGGRERFARAIPTLKHRAATLPLMIAEASFAVQERPIAFTDKAKVQLSEDSIARLQRLSIWLNQTIWTPDALHQILADFVAAENIGMGKIGPPLRASLTGGLPSPDLAQVLYILGRDEALARLADVTKG